MATNVSPASANLSHSSTMAAWLQPARVEVLALHLMVCFPSDFPFSVENCVAA
jgi:hypothetical protein